MGCRDFTQEITHSSFCCLVYNTSYFHNVLRGSDVHDYVCRVGYFYQHVSDVHEYVCRVGYFYQHVSDVHEYVCRVGYFYQHVSDVHEYVCRVGYFHQHVSISAIFSLKAKALWNQFHRTSDRSDRRVSSSTSSSTSSTNFKYTQLFLSKQFKISWEWEFHMWNSVEYVAMTTDLTASMT